MNSYLNWMLEQQPTPFANYKFPDDVPMKVSLLDLHPMCRGQFALLQVRLIEAYNTGAIRNRFCMFMGYRSPEEQDGLYAQGRTKTGPKVTNAPAWTSSHQFGLAVDFVPHDPGVGWHWDPKADWDGLREMAHARGLVNTIKWDRPHVWHPAHDMLVRRIRQTA